jgi:hyperosmotically inducible protein
MLKRFITLPRVLSALFLFATLVTGCDRGRFGSAAMRDSDMGMAGREPGAGTTESDLESIIRTRLGEDRQLKGAGLRVTVDAGRNVVTLSGAVETRAMRDRAVALARTARSGVVVHDEIEIRPREVSRSEYTEDDAREERERAKERGELIGDSPDDAWIHTNVVAILAGDPDASQGKIHVDVRNSVVTLRGVVETSKQRADAERVTKEIEGVKGVINQLRFIKPIGGSLGAYYA